jgi:hypothetical protein
LRCLDRKGRVDGREDQPAAGKMRPHDCRKHRPSGSVQNGPRLVEQPDGTQSCEQTGKREASSLSGRKVECRQVSERAKAHASKRRCDLAGTAENTAPESEILGDGQGWLQGVLVADIVSLFTDAQLSIAARDSDPALSGLKETGNQAKER